MTAMDFTALFQRLGKNIAENLRQLMNHQTGTDGMEYGKLDEKTVARKEAMGVGQNASLRMIATRDFQTNAFLYEAMPDGLRVYVNPAQHGRALKSMQKTLGKYLHNPAKFGRSKVYKQAAKVAKASQREPTYRDLARYQLDTGKAQFFPATVPEIMNLPAITEFRDELELEARTQMESLLDVRLSQELIIG